MAKSKAAPLSPQLLIQKGSAIPAAQEPGSTQEANSTPNEDAYQKSEPLPIQKIIEADIQQKPVTKRASVLEETTPVTVRLEQDLYERLKLFGIRSKPRKRTNQDILVAALTDYLNKHEKN